MRKAVILLVAGACVTTHAGQVIRDGTVGPTGALPGPDFIIPDTDGQTRGNNLFHSFTQFDLNQGESATFTGPANIHNVISRVTGGNASTIDGTLNCAIDGANFFFINPFGVVFGEHAQVNVSGSFAVTTADYVKLADGGRFDARNPVNDVLTAAPVSAFGFLGPTVAPITLNGVTLDSNNPSILTFVPDGKSIWLVGGSIEHNGFFLGAPAGQIVAVSVASSGELSVDVDDPNATVNTSSFGALGNITIAHNAELYTSGAPGGRVVLDGDRITFLDNGGANADNFGDTASGGIELHARTSIEIDNSVLSTFVLGDGDGGSIKLDAPLIELTDSSINTDTVGNGRAGDIVITANNLSIFGGSISVTAGSTGAGGDLNVTAEHLHIEGGSLLASSFGAPAGNITLQANTIELAANARIQSDSVQEGSLGGDVNITAHTLILDDQHGSGQTQISSRSIDTGSGGGNILLDVDHLEVRNGAQISATTFNDGPAGSVIIHGNDVIVEGFGSQLVGADTVIVPSTISSASADSQTTQSGGTAGSVTLQLSGSLLLQNGGMLSVSSVRNDGGDVTVSAGDSIRLLGGQISAQANGDGGNVHLTAPALIYLLDSKVTAESVSGNGGNVTLDPQLTVLNRSAIIAKAIVGHGGNIDIVSDFFLAGGSVIDASSEFGLQGTVNITSPNSDLAGNFVGLNADPLDAESRLRPHCSVRLPGGVSSFTIVGRGGTPIEPDGLLPALPPALAK